MENAIMIIDIEKKIHTSNGDTLLKIEAEFNSGELVSIFGPSGVGKTTLLRIIAGLTNADKGEIIVNKKIWFNSKKKINIPVQERNIGFVFQDFALFPNMNVEENIYYAQKNKNKSIVTNILDTFDLTVLAKRKPQSLSGGQKQRVALARALAYQPDFLFLDEPLSALDAQTRFLLQNEILQSHKKYSKLTMLVSHDLSEVFRLANKVLRINENSEVTIGTPEEVFSVHSISGKVQITGKVVNIEKQDVVNIVTVITNNNTIIKVVALDSDLENFGEGDDVLVYSKAFNPIIKKVH